MGRIGRDTYAQYVSMVHDNGLYLPGRLIYIDSPNNTGDNEIDYASASRFIKNIKILNAGSKDPIMVILNTNGGDVVHGLAIYDAIKNSTAPVIIKVFGSASSIGAIILQAADERIMSPHSYLMFHKGSSSTGASNDYEVLKEATFSLEYGNRTDNILLDRINEKRTKENKALLSKQSFKSMLLESRYLFPEQAIEWGLADRVE